MIGYDISGGFNKGFFFDPDVAPPPEGVRCSLCKSCLDFDYVPSMVPLHRSSQYDVSYTYDGRCLVSERFVQWILDKGFLPEDLFQFVPTGHAFKYYYLLAHRLPVLECDVARSKVRFGKICPQCDQPEYIVGPGFLKIEHFPHQGFFTEDLTFGGMPREKSYSILVDPETGDRMKQQKFRGLHLGKYYGFLDPDDAIRMENMKNNAKC